MATDYIPFNLNDDMRITLTDKGVRVYEEYFHDLKAPIPELPFDRKLQMPAWEIMQIFGSKMYHGNPEPVMLMDVTLVQKY